MDFDEGQLDSDSTHGGGHIAVVMWGPIVKAGYKQTSSTLYQHQSMLRTEMELLGLSSPPGAAVTVAGDERIFPVTEWRGRTVGIVIWRPSSLLSDFPRTGMYMLQAVSGTGE